MMVDPKMVEFSIYSKIERHYLAKLPNAEKPIVTEPADAVATLNSLVIEMEDRYRLLVNANVRNIKEYNAKFIERRLNPQKGHRFLPYIVAVVDEFADLIAVAGREIELPISYCGEGPCGRYPYDLGYATPGYKGDYRYDQE